jgi:hypothetical protein
MKVSVKELFRILTDRCDKLAFFDFNSFLNFNFLKMGINRTDLSLFKVLIEYVFYDYDITP